ncbi:MAG: nucleotidyltransferase family protein [Cyanobacteria bacterium K_DeepCast_35m_m2_023]|nr:nucleotidyltransferase family protein [Cyanobacteria bacterium K_DeepCast_35m_m2_023]
MKKPFRALLLAAGLGTRLRPITLHTPKCLVSIGGKPLLGRWLRQLEIAGCESALVNTHHLANQVEAFVRDWNSPTMRVSTVHEPDLLGTAGTLRANISFFEESTGLLIHADNAMTDSLGPLLTAHEQRADGCELTMLTFQTDTPRNCGIVTTNSEGVVTAFHEKVEEPPGNCANAALYAFNPNFLIHLEQLKPPPSDFSTEVIPQLMGRIQSFHTYKPYLDIGTLHALTQAQQMQFPEI